ncbi:MAG: PrsW family intramembrane metalloprotease [Verrucomicrobia bacterium]|nr:PrsW family intramembrane metalloprotease [Verrucomicrobiota bacterium]MCH8511296.1 PrsW family intramembrane metalloprotease [Kiritimatiellia bacterium]
MDLISVFQPFLHSPGPASPFPSIPLEIFESAEFTPETTPARLGLMLLSDGADGVLPLLNTMADLDAPDKGIQYLLGVYHMRRGNYSEAGMFFKHENQAHPDSRARYAHLDALFRGDLDDQIDALQNDPTYRQEMRGSFLMRVGLRRGDWRQVFEHFWIAEYAGLRPSLLFLTLLSGSVWVIIFLHILPPGELRRLLGLSILALALGWMSTWPTLWSDMWMRLHLPIEPGTDFFSQFLYFTLSVGVREELCKLLLFVPLLPWVLKKGTDLDALLLGAMVGLGFAIEENINYFDQILTGGITVGRFVSANFLHATLTGACALALTRMVRSPARWLQDSLTVIASAILLHGVYNTLLSAPLPGFGDMSYFAGTALAGCAILFFREVRAHSQFRGRMVSITGLFFWGLCVLINMELVMSALILPVKQAVEIVGHSALASIVSAFVFLHHVNEPLGE